MGEPEGAVLVLRPTGAAGAHGDAAPKRPHKRAVGRSAADTINTDVKPFLREPPSAAGDRADHEERFAAGCDRFRQDYVDRVMREILATGKEAEERPALLRHVVADRAAQHRKIAF